jgi:hypothetical protein
MDFTLVAQSMSFTLVAFFMVHVIPAKVAVVVPSPEESPLPRQTKLVPAAILADGSFIAIEAVVFSSAELLGEQGGPQCK